MRLLITNDDGINSYGLHMLVKKMEKDNEIIVIAPDNQRSACGHSITIGAPILVREVKIEGIKSRAFSVSGTPADCVKVGVEKLISKKIDMVISGINYGLNIGTDVIYSGTVSAAIESSIYKIPSMAVSMYHGNSNDAFEIALKYIEEILLKAHKNKIKNDFVLNVNIPVIKGDGVKGIKICSLGNRIYSNYYIETINENMEKGYQLKGEPSDEHDEDTDVQYIKEGYVTVTPLHYDLTNYGVIDEVNGWFKE